MKRQFDDILLGSIELFCLAAEFKNFTAAAVEAGVTPAAVSRSVSRLEQRLGVRLFVRTTRQVRLTEPGQAYFEQCREALGRLVEAERQVTGQQMAPAGVLRISIPTPYGHCRVLPMLGQYRALYPDVQVQVHLSNRNIDFVEEGFDLAIRGRLQPDSNLIARKLEDAELVLVATPHYLARCGTPATLDDLQRHDCIQFELPSDGRRINWMFRQKGVDLDVPTTGSYCIADDVLGCVTLARHGVGLLQTYRYIVEDDLASGALVELLKECGGRSRPVTLLYPQNRHVPLRVRSFVQFLVKKLAEPMLYSAHTKGG
jgi:DNA-binding transcriptional LysR family regulator